MRVLPATRVVGVLCLLAPLIGCMGWGDMFREKRPIAGDYFLMEGEQDSTDDLYLFTGNSAASVAGPLNRIGWNPQYIIFTDANWPVQWNVMDVNKHIRFTITDTQRTQDPRFQQIDVGSTSQAWQRAKHLR
jgi:hypothetical protein